MQNMNAESDDGEVNETETLPSDVYKPFPQELSFYYRAAGVIPLAVHESNLYFLLGREPSSHKSKKRREKWNDFGGKREKSDKSPEETAIRELIEESKMFPFGEMEKYINLLKNNQFPIIWYKYGRYIIYFLQIEFNPQFKIYTDENDLQKEEKTIDLSSIEIISNSTQPSPSNDPQILTTQSNIDNNTTNNTHNIESSHFPMDFEHAQTTTTSSTTPELATLSFPIQSSQDSCTISNNETSLATLEIENTSHIDAIHKKHGIQNFTSTTIEQTTTSNDNSDSDHDDDNQTTTTTCTTSFETEITPTSSTKTQQIQTIDNETINANSTKKKKSPRKRKSKQQDPDATKKQKEKEGNEGENNTNDKSNENDKNNNEDKNNQKSSVEKNVAKEKSTVEPKEKPKKHKKEKVKPPPLTEEEKEKGREERNIKKEERRKQREKELLENPPVSPPQKEEKDLIQWFPPSFFLQQGVKSKVPPFFWAMLRIVSVKELFGKFEERLLTNTTQSHHQTNM